MKKSRYVNIRILRDTNTKLDKRRVARGKTKIDHIDDLSNLTLKEIEVKTKELCNKQ